MYKNSKLQPPFNPLIGPLSGAITPDQSVPSAMAMKGYYIFPKTPALLEPYHQIFCVISRTFVRDGGSYPSAGKQSVYSTAPADRVK